MRPGLKNLKNQHQGTNRAVNAKPVSIKGPAAKTNALSLLKEVFSLLGTRRDLVRYLMIRNIKIRYKNSSLGFFWTLLNPLLMMLIYFVFIRLLRFSVDLPFLITGVICWHFTNLCLNDSIGTVAGNTNLIKKVYFPRVILPVSMVLANAVNAILSFVVLFAFLLIFKIGFTANLLLLPAVFLVHLLFCLGCSLVLSALSVYFDDTKHILSAVLQAWFFLSPVIYPSTMVPDRFIPFFIANPMTGILSMYRQCFLNTHWDWTLPAFAISTGFAVLATVLGMIFFEKYQRYFADEL